MPAPFVMSKFYYVQNWRLNIYLSVKNYSIFSGIISTSFSQRTENSDWFSRISVMGKWPKNEGCVGVIGWYLQTASHVYFHERLFHYSTAQQSWKTHQRCKRIPCDHLFPLVKKGRGACSIVVPLIKSGTAFCPVCCCTGPSTLYMTLKDTYA